jgi:phosphate transport system protein
MTDITQGHTITAYDKELAQLRGLVLEAGELVVEQVGDAVKALCDGDFNLGRRVVEQDHRVDQFDMDVDAAILRIVALRQPAASDLRLVLALSKIMGEISSAGNKARKIAACSIRLHAQEGRQPSSRLLRDVKLMKDRACSMLERSIDALSQMDVTEAIGVLKEDDELDEEFDAGMRHLVTFMLEDSSALSRVLDMVFVLKALERVGDHANHIARQVIFVAEGRDVRYLSSEVLEASHTSV